MTSQAAAILQQGMDPFKIRVDWLCHDAYGTAVYVELHVMGKEPVVLRRFSTTGEAASWARKWMEDRGFNWWCNIDLHQRQGHTHITLHPCSLRSVAVCEPSKNCCKQVPHP